MSLINILYTIFISPLQLFFEAVYMMANKIIDNPGISIVVLSLAMNLLVLPLYRRADAIQEEERDMEMKLSKGVKHIKKMFKGDERMMMLQTYYKQNDYKPSFVFKGALSLFLEIPFFIAAYQFLSHLKVIQGVSFWIIDDLGRPDSLLSIKGMSVNLLPIIMTIVNLVSCVIFTKGAPVKTKVQLYSMAVFFFFFLYRSPSGLVFYWTLNNLFSLVKTIFYKLKRAGLILKVMSAVIGIFLFGYAVSHYDFSHRLRLLGLSGLGIAGIIPLLLSVIKKYTVGIVIFKKRESNGKIFLFGAIYLIVLIGCTIPSAVIQSSPQEFTDALQYLNPLWYVCSSLCMAAGTFLVWSGVFYKLAKKEKRVFFEMTIWFFCGISTINYLFFGKNLGLLTNSLVFEKGLHFSGLQQLRNIGVLIVTVGVLSVVFITGRKWIPQILFVCSLAFLGLTAMDVVKINASMTKMQIAIKTERDDVPSFQLSKEGKNVVIIMLDRAMNQYIPYFMSEREDFQELFEGFTYYCNTLSYGGFTNFGSPAIYGGYEYTPHEINRRSTESLKQKQNEALKIMPVLFDENGFEVTVCDPTYANYQWFPDLSIYDDYPNIRKYITKGRFMDQASKGRFIDNNKRNFFCYSIMKVSPLFLQGVLYDDGNYHQGTYTGTNETMDISIQIAENNYVSNGVDLGFFQSYSVMENLTLMTDVTKDRKNTFLLLTNDMTHDTILLQEPEYRPAQHVDNTEYETKHMDRYTVNGKQLKMETKQHFTHYQCNMAALLRLGEWFDYLREEGVYDNTRIILVSDHAMPLYQMGDSMVLDDGSNQYYNTEFYYPLLMVKDFGSKGFTTSEEFMTNADVPTIALKGLVNNPVNPFTGKEITDMEKLAHDQYVLGSDKWNVDENNGNIFLPGIWMSVHDDVRKKENWKILHENAVMPFE